MWNILKGLLGIGLLIGIAFAAGVRVHPEILTGSKSKGPVLVSQKVVKLTLKNGQTLTGKIVKKTPNGIVFSFEGAEVNFSNSEIASKSEKEVSLSNQMAETGNQLSSFVTYEPDQSLFKDFLSAYSSPFKKTSGPRASALRAVSPKPAIVDQPAAGVGNIPGNRYLETARAAQKKINQSARDQ